MVSDKVALKDLRFVKIARVMAAVAALTVLAACTQEQADVEPEDPLRPVKTVEIGQPDQGWRMDYAGAVKARTEMALGFRVGGKITERGVDIGQHVGPGDVLARLDATDYELSVRSAQASLAAAKKQEEIAALARNRAESLFSKKIASRSDLEQALLVHEQAISSREAAEANLDQARNQAAYTALQSDLSGIVTAIGADRGQVVSAGTPVVHLAVDGAREVEIAVPEMDILHFSTGKTVKASFWSEPGLALEGTVREIAGSANPQSRTFAVRVSLPNDPRILLGMTATIEASEENGAPTYAIPLSALDKRGEQPIVWVVDRQALVVRPRTVTIENFSDDGIRVSEGLEPGELVVSAGTQFMKDEMKVKLPDTVALDTSGPKVDTASVLR